MASRRKRILVMLDDIGPGDGLRSRFAVAAIRSAHPEARITILVSESAAGVFANESAPDEIVVSRLYRAGATGSWGRRVHKLAEGFRLLRTVGLGHDLVFVLNWGTSTLDVLGRLAGRRVIGYDNQLPFLLSRRLGRYHVEGDAVEQNRNLLLSAGISLHQGAPVEGPVAAAAELSVPEPYAVLHTGSDWACQQWTQPRWVELADRLVGEYGLTIVFTGLGHETRYIADIQAHMRRPSTSVAGGTTVADLQHLLSNASLCVSVDSAPYELAQLAGTPIIVLAGPTSARPQMVRESRPIVVNRTPTELGLQIRVCQRTHADGQCHDYACPFSQLPSIEVDDVLAAVGLLRIRKGASVAAT